MGAVETVGRILFVLIFLGSAAHKFHTRGTEEGRGIMEYMSPKLQSFLTKVEESTGFSIPLEERMYPQVLSLAATLEAVGGLLVLFDKRVGAILLAFFMIPTTFIMHNFWELPEGRERDMEMAHFMKNVSMTGALLIYFGSSQSRRNKRLKLE